MIVGNRDGSSRSGCQPAGSKRVTRSGCKPPGSAAKSTITRSTSFRRDFGFTTSELRRLRALKTPAGVQKFLDEIPYNLGYTARSPEKVLRAGKASCFEGAVFAAAALRVLGFPPLIFDLEADRDTDHVLAIFNSRVLWRSVAKSNFAGCRYREPV